jgi:hypothetical protein
MLSCESCLVWYPRVPAYYVCLECTVYPVEVGMDEGILEDCL